MESIKGVPYFDKVKNQIKQYNYLNHDLGVDILIIGGGIDGAITNYYLSQNFNVALVDSKRFGMGCTSSATALLEYQLDDYATKLKKVMSEEDIVDIYNMGLYSLEKIEKFIKKYGNECMFQRRPTLLYSNNLLDFNDIEKEYEFRKNNGFLCDIIDEYNNPFEFKVKRGLYVENGGGEFNPYLFTKQLLENSKNQDLMYENTEVESIDFDGSVYTCRTKYGDYIKCKKIILATAFNFDLLEKKDYSERYVTYSIVTSPLEKNMIYNYTLVQDTKKPYHYLRTLKENRLIFGGEDTKYNGKIDKEKAQEKYKKLEEDLNKIFPSIEGKYHIEHKFCGLFGSTDNNLGMIGECEEKGIILNLSMGANGIINAMYGVEIIEDILRGKENKLAHLFSPKRLKF